MDYIFRIGVFLPAIGHLQRLCVIHAGPHDLF